MKSANGVYSKSYTAWAVKYLEDTASCGFAVEKNRLKMHPKACILM